VKKLKQSADDDVAKMPEETPEETATDYSKQSKQQRKREQQKTNKQNDVKKGNQSAETLERPAKKPEENLETSAVDAQQSKRKCKREQQKMNKINDTKNVKPSVDNGVLKKPEKAEKPGSRVKGKEATPKKPMELKKSTKPERVDNSIAMMDPKLIADFVGQKLRRLEKDMSAVELEDSFIPEKSFGNTTDFDQPRLLENLSSFLQKFHTLGPSKEHCGLDQVSEKPGSPHTIIIAAAALRATDLVRAVKPFQTKENMIAKLFAKHIKFRDAADTCRSTRMGIAVGTPKRIADLVKDEALQLKALERIVIDASALNDKNQGIFDIRETYSALMELLKHPSVKERLGEQTAVLLY